MLYGTFHYGRRLGGSIVQLAARMQYIRFTPGVRPRCFQTASRVLSKASRPKPVLVEVPGPKPAKPNKPVEYAFPELLRIYATPPRKLYSVLLQKVVYIFLVIGACLVGFPYLIEVQDKKKKRNWLDLLALYTISLGPFTVYSILSAPFVVSITLLLPPPARVSKQTLFKYLNNLPKNNYAVVQGLRIFPLPKSTSLNLRDVQFTQSNRWYEMTNMERIGHPEKENVWQKWRTYGRSRFYVDPKFDELEAGLNERVRAPGAWAAVKAHIEKTSRTALKGSAKR